MGMIEELRRRSAPAVERLRPWRQRIRACFPKSVTGRIARFLRFTVKLAWNGLAVLGLISVLAGLYASYRVMHHYNLTPRQFVLKVAKKSGIDNPLLEALVTPSPRYPDHEFQGQLVLDNHPRLIPGGRKALEAMRARYRQDPDYAKEVDRFAATSSMLHQAVAWAASGNEEAGDKAIRSLVSVSPVLPRESGNYGNGLTIALTYDLLREHPTWTPDMRARIGLTLRRMLKETLLLLDSDPPSMWHGRFQLGCSAWIVAAAMDVEDWEADKALFSQVQRHFIESLHAIRITGGWPGGYNYWINNRAFPFVMAATAHINAVNAPELNNEIRDTLETVGLWTIHGTEPRGRFTLFGDTGPRVDLKDETQRIIDVIGAVTGSDVFRDYSRYLTGLHGREGYYAPYRWGAPLFRGMADRDFAPSDALDSLRIFQGRLPTSAVFGRGGFGQVFSRSDWGPQATHLSFHAGHTFAHHGHYQNGHFTLSKGKTALALTSGTYGDYFSPHRLNYYIRTVAANSLLVLRPGETVYPNRFFWENAADGGQRIVIPTGSEITSIDNWRDNLGDGNHYEGGAISAFDNSQPGIMYVGADLTPAYNSVDYDDNGDGGKVAQVTRQMIHLQEHDLVLVHDRVTATNPEYPKKWLLHTWTKPATATERVLRGSEHNGILESLDREATIAHEDAVLRVVRLLPARAMLRKVGGPEYRFFVNSEGIDLAGRNMAEGVKDQPWFDTGLWRLEIQPQSGNLFDRFLVVLQVGAAEQFRPVSCQSIEGDQIVGACLPNHVVLFGKKGTWKGTATYTVPEGEARTNILVDLPPNRPVHITAGEQTISMKSSPEGMVTFDLDAQPRPVRVTVRVK